VRPQTGGGVEAIPGKQPPAFSGDVIDGVEDELEDSLRSGPS